MENYTKEQLEILRAWFPRSFDRDGNYIGGKKEEEKEPKLETEEELKAALSDAFSENGYRETEAEMKTLAEEEKAAGKTAESEAARRSEELYQLLLSYGEKQNGRYDDLIAAIAEGDYRKNAGAAEILEEYRTAAEREGAHAFAGEAAENGGNPDSYAAAQAARSRLAVTKAGEEAARAYYGEQLDRLLEAISASGADMSRLYGSMQDNVDERSDAADNALSLAAELFGDLAAEENDRRAGDLKLFSSLLDRNEETGVKNPDISPMELDREYAKLVGDIKADNTVKINALITLWQKYPTMRSYLKEMYKELNVPVFLFK